MRSKRLPLWVYALYLVGFGICAYSGVMKADGAALWEVVFLASFVPIGLAQIGRTRANRRTTSTERTPHQ